MNPKEMGEEIVMPYFKPLYFLQSELRKTMNFCLDTFILSL